jgi:hypothetical protein
MNRAVVVRMLGVLCAILTANAVVPGPSHGAEPVVQRVGTTRIEDAIDKGMRWLQAHPADVRRHEVVEVAEETMFYYALWVMASAPEELERYRAQIARRHRAIGAFNEELLETGLHLQGIWGPLTYPPLTHIISRMEMADGSYRSIVDDIVDRHPGLLPARDTMQLWIAVYLERLGYPTATPVALLLERSPLRRDPRTSALLNRFAVDPQETPDRQATVQLVYDMTHEVLALTDFGALPAPGGMMEDRDHYALLFDRAMRWAMQAAAIDILAELLVSAHLLALHDLPSVPAAVDLILRTQQADGSFGVTNPDRPNGRRHGVLTCVLALKTAGTWPDGR